MNSVCDIKVLLDFMIKLHRNSPKEQERGRPDWFSAMVLTCVVDREKVSGQPSKYRALELNKGKNGAVWMTFEE